MEQHRERVRDENKEVKGIQLRLKKQRLDTGERNKDKDRQWGKSQQRKRQRVLGECAKVRQMLKAGKQSVPSCVSSQRLNSKTAVWHKKEQNRRHERGRRKKRVGLCLSVSLSVCMLTGKCSFDRTGDPRPTSNHHKPHPHKRGDFTTQLWSGFSTSGCVADTSQL